MPPVAISGVIAAGMTELRRPPDVVGRVGRPAHSGRRLATIVVWTAAAGETMRVPPMQQAPAVRVPATDRVQPLEEVLLAWLATPGISTECPSAGHQGQP